MSTTTTNLELFKYDSEADKNRYFNLNDSMNNNWDKIDTFAGTMSTHASATNNPHSVTKAQLGLGNCDNTSDANKPISTATQSALDLKANAADVLTALALKADKSTLHALKSYADNGELLTDTQGLSDVTNYAHSTFCGYQASGGTDPKKFTKEGTGLVITSDGIASGFSGTDFLTADIDLASSDSWEIIAPVILTSTPAVEIGIFSFGGTSGSNRLDYTPSNGRLMFYFTTTDGNKYISAINFSFALNTDYLFRVKFTGTQYSLSYSINNGVTWTSVGTPIDSTAKVTNGDNLRVGIGYSTSYPLLNGVVDLKQVRVKSNEIPVFSGNKTGIDTVKADDFATSTSPNEPTISADGILTTTATNQWVKKNIDFSLSKNWTFEIGCKIKGNSAGTDFVIGTCMLTSQTDQINVICRGLNSSSILANFALTVIPSSYNNKNINVIWQHNITNGLRAGYKLANDNNYIWGEWSTSMADVSSGWLYEQLTGASDLVEFDLNAVKYYENGNLVYQPCLKIPYTEAGNGKGYNASTGSKIVNAIYRDRVNDMADQFGYANYYTLDEDNGNFTLPQVELYGYIEKRARDIAHPVAQPFYRFSDEINDDEVRLEGAEVDKGLYLAIEDILSDYCTAGSTPDKICLPDFRGRVPWGAGDYGYIAAGLPNIKGSLALGSGSTATGCFYKSGTTTGEQGGGGGTDDQGYFNADRGAGNLGIYNDNCKTVQPPAFKVRWLCRWK